MDWIIWAVLFSILGICAILIIVTLISLPQLGDERKNFIKMKAQSFTFAIVIGYVLIQLFKKIYINIYMDSLLQRLQDNCEIPWIGWAELSLVLSWSWYILSFYVFSPKSRISFDFNCTYSLITQVMLVNLLIGKFRF